MKRWFGVLSFSVVVASVGAGCGQQSDSPPATSAPAAAPAAPPASSGEIGVAECDEYLTQVQNCVDNQVPEDAKDAQRQALNQLRDQWRQAASNPTGRAALAAGCKAAMDNARSSLAVYGCEF